MALKPGYKQPGRQGLVSLTVWLTPEMRDALKVAAIETGTTVQSILSEAAQDYVAKRVKVEAKRIV